MAANQRSIPRPLPAPRLWSRSRRGILAAALCLVLVLLQAPGLSVSAASRVSPGGSGAARTAATQQRIHPRLFTVPAGDFPSDSHIARSNVETNDRLAADELTHFGLPPGVVGRITGYYMLAREAPVGAGAAPYTSYLVSIFRTVHQAQSAFDYRWDLWFMRNFYTTPPAPQVKLGDGNAKALFHTLDPRLPATTELFFRRGCVLVEVLQGNMQNPPTAEQTRSLYAIAGALDVVAHAHPRGV